MKIVMFDSSSLGYLKDTVHILPLRVYYEDTDLSGMVYHANYARFMERGRAEFFHSIGICKLAELDTPDPTVWTVHKLEITYLQPSRIDDLLEVHTSIKNMTKARIQLEQTIFCPRGLATKGLVEICLTTVTGKVRRISQDMYDKLLPFQKYKDTILQEKA